MFRLLLVLLITAQAITLQLYGTPPLQETSSLNETVSLEKELQNIYKSSAIVGFQAGIVTQDGLLWGKGFGATHPHQGKPMTLNTPMRWGSISKTFTALTIARFVATKRLHWEDRLANILPEVPYHNPWEATNPICLIHLAEHTAGWDDVPYYDFAFSQEGHPVTAYAHRHSRDRKSHWPPGLFFRYANGGPAILGAVLEKVDKQPFDKIVRQEIFLPLGMSQATFSPDSTLFKDISPSWHPGYSQPERYWHMPIRPSGALVATGNEISQFITVLLNRGTLDDGQIWLPEDELIRCETMEASAAARAGVTNGYAKGIFHFICADRIWYGHWGKVDGFLACYGYLPTEGRGFFLVCNTSDGRNRWKLMEALARHTASGLPTPSTTKKFLTANLTSWEGTYENSTPDRELAAFPLSFLGLNQIQTTSEEFIVSRDLPYPSQQRYRAISNTLFEINQCTGAVAALLELNQSKYFIPGEALKQLSWTDLFIRKGLLVLGALSLILSILLAIYTLWNIFRSKLNGQQALWLNLPSISLWLALAQIIIIVYGLLLNSLSISYEHFGTLSLTSGAVFVISLLWPMLTLSACFKTKHISSLPLFWKLSHHIIVINTLAWALWFFTYDWIGLRTWGY